jgi:2-dehydropantoate 2-reductase
VGGTVAAALARSDHPVTLLVRPEAVDRYPRRLSIDSSELGRFEVDVAVGSSLAEPVDVLWVTVKATQLPEALRAAPLGALADGVVVPLLNGIEHVQLLRDHYGPERVIPGTIRTESIRVAPGVIEHRRWHAPPGKPPIELAASGPLELTAQAIATEVSAAGIGCVVTGDETALLWRKLSLIAIGVILALVTGPEREDPELRALQEQAAHEVAAVADSEGVTVDEELMLRLIADPPNAQSSFQRDLEAGRPTELDAIIGALIRIGHRRGVGVTALEGLRDLGAAKAAARVG